MRPKMTHGLQRGNSAIEMSAKKSGVRRIPTTVLVAEDVEEVAAQG
jgi:hypothetical protein